MWAERHSRIREPIGAEGVAGGVGLPFPEDLTLLAAGALAQPGLLRLTHVVLAGLAGGAGPGVRGGRDGRDSPADRATGLR